MYQLWQSKSILCHSLQTSDQKSLLIINAGKRNHYSGPDFNQAHIRLNDMDWFGSVEIHVKSSDWHLHKHHVDPSYNNVILHVVWEYDACIQSTAGNEIPCLILSQFVKNPASFLPNTTDAFLCQKLIHCVPTSIINEMKANCLKKRLGEKVAETEKIWLDCNKDWEETIYRSIAKALGFQQNAEAMYRLACSIPLKLIWNYRESPLRIEAMFFGQAGLLEQFPIKEQINNLKLEYQFLKHKHLLEPTFLEHSNWKYFKLRPQNYPNIRIYELGHVLKSNVSLLTFLLDMQDIQNLKILFELHVDNKKKNFGEQAFKSLVINGIIPILLIYARDKSASSYHHKAMDWLESLKPEGHSLEKQFLHLGLTAKHAGDSQSFIYWKRNYCDKKRCSSCKIGNYVFPIP